MWVANLTHSEQPQDDPHLPHYVLRRNTRGDYQVSVEITRGSFARGHHSRHLAPPHSDGHRVTVPFHEVEALAYDLPEADETLLVRLADEYGLRAESVPLDPESDVDLFLSLVQTRRAYVESLDGERTRLRRGRGRRGELTYMCDERGTQLPVAAIAAIDDDGRTSQIAYDPRAILLGEPPSRYFDPRAAEVGELVFDVADEVVRAWVSGYAIPPGQTKAVREALAARGLPGPKDVMRKRAPVAVKARLESVAADSNAGPDEARVLALAEAAPGVWRRFADVAPQIVQDETTITILEPDPAALEELSAALSQGGFHRRDLRRPATSSFVLGDGSRYEAEHAVRAALRGTPFEVEVAPDYAFGSREVGVAELGLHDDGDGAYSAGLFVEMDGEKVDVLPALLATLHEEGALPKYGMAFDRGGKTYFLPVARVASIRSLLLELATRPGSTRIPRLRALGLPPDILPRSPESLDALRRELRSPRDVTLPSGLSATLRGYQTEGFRWLVARRRLGLGAVLADDMGLGKTIQTIALLLSEREGGANVPPSLVVCPKSVAPNWFDELTRFAPSLRVVEHHGKDRTADDAGFTEADVIVTTYPIMVRDAAIFAKHTFSTIVLDEAQSIKTPTSGMALAAFELKGAFRLALTGTPLENHLGELWSLCRFVLPELLPDTKTFGKIYRRPIENRGDTEARAALRGRLFPFLLRRTKELVASDLPPKTLVVTRVELDSAQRDVYETIRASMSARVAEALASRGLQQAHIIILDALLKLRQAVCDPRLLPLAAAKKAGSAKLAHLVAMVSELVGEGRRVLVFSQFVTMLERIEAELVAAKIPYTMLTGQTEDRRTVVAEFAKGGVPVFLLSLKAGGTGLNLTAADVVIHYDPWWNPAAENQATDRAHRIGQTQPVFVYKLIGKQTIEEKILALQERKQALFSSILDDGAEVAKKLSEDDVRFLFS